MGMPEIWMHQNYERHLIFCCSFASDFKSMRIQRKVPLRHILPWNLLHVIFGFFGTSPSEASFTDISSKLHLKDIRMMLGKNEVSTRSTSTKNQNASEPKSISGEHWIFSTHSALLGVCGMVLCSPRFSLTSNQDSDWPTCPFFFIANKTLHRSSYASRRTLSRNIIAVYSFTKLMTQAQKRNIATNIWMQNI